MFAAIAIYKPADVRPILEAYQGKNIPIEYAKKEAEAKQKHIEQWNDHSKGLSDGGFTLSRLFASGGTVSVLVFSEKWRMLTCMCVILERTRAAYVPRTEAKGGADDLS